MNITSGTKAKGSGCVLPSGRDALAFSRGFLRTVSILLMVWGAGVAGGAAGSEGDAKVISETESIWIRRNGSMVEVEPGTEEYYKLRIKGTCHIEDGRLIRSHVIYGKILKAFDGNRLWVREMDPIRETTPDGEIRGYVPADDIVVSVQSTNGITGGGVVSLQLAEDGVDYICKQDSGSERRLRGYRVVKSPSFDEYSSVCRSGATEMVEPPVLLSIEPVRADRRKQPVDIPAGMKQVASAKEDTDRAMPGQSSAELRAQIRELQTTRVAEERKIRDRTRSLARLKEVMKTETDSEIKAQIQQSVERMEQMVDASRKAMADCDSRVKTLYAEYRKVRSEGR